MGLYLSIVHWVVVAFLVLNVLLIIDWVLGIDKLTPIVSDFLDKHTSAEIVAPFMIFVLVCEFGLIVDWITENDLVHAAYLSIGALGLGLGLLIVSVILLAKGLYCIRQYFLNRKKL